MLIGRSINLNPEPSLCRMLLIVGPSPLSQQAGLVLRARSYTHTFVLASVSLAQRGAGSEQRCLCPCLPGCRLHPAGAGGRGRAHRAPPVAVPARPAHPGLAQLPPAAGAAARPAPPHRARRHSRKQGAAAPPELFYFTQGKVIWETCYKLCTSL